MAAEWTWEEKFASLQALGCDMSVRMRSPGDWYVIAGGRLFKHDMLLSGDTGDGKTPQEAILNDWEKCIANVVVMHADDPKRRRQYRWTGLMWQEIGASS